MQAVDAAQGTPVLEKRLNRDIEREGTPKRMRQTEWRSHAR